MEKNDWQDQKNNNGSDFMKVVQDAINSGDYQQLNEQAFHRRPWPGQTAPWAPAHSPAGCRTSPDPCGPGNSRR